MYQIYILLFTSGHYYIGRSKNYQSRYAVHKSDLKKNKHRNRYMQNIYNKYGSLPKCILLMHCIDCHSIEQILIDYHYRRDKCLNLSNSSKGGGSENCTPPIRYRDVSTRCNIKTKDFPTVVKLLKILPTETIAKYYKVHISTLNDLCKTHNFISDVPRRTKPRKKLNTFKQLGDRLPEFIMDSFRLDKKILADKYEVCVSTIINWQRIFQIKNNNE